MINRDSWVARTANALVPTRYGLEQPPHYRDSRERAARRPRHARCDQLRLHRSQPARGRRRSSPSRIAFSPESACIARILDVYAALDGAVTSHYEVTSHPEIFDGVRLHTGQSVAVIRHNARVILSCERVILNFLQRMSGIATLTRKFVEAVSGTKARILDTRKTAPGLRVIDKYAVRCGGGQNHRLDLSDGVLIKNNHIALAGGIVPALERAHPQPPRLAAHRNRSPHARRTGQALAHGAEAILLDNMSVDDVRRRWSDVRSRNFRKKAAASRSNVRAESVWRMFAPTPKPASTSSQLAC